MMCVQIDVAKMAARVLPGCSLAPEFHVRFSAELLVEGFGYFFGALALSASDPAAAPA
jgi:hypothetical protein